MSHTSGRWHYDQDSKRITNEDGYEIGMVPDCDEADDDGYRIVACVNACRHLTTEQLEAGDLDYAGLSTLADIRAALGVGERPMLSDLPKIVREVRDQAERCGIKIADLRRSASVLRRAIVWWRNHCRAHNERKEALEWKSRAEKAEGLIANFCKECLSLTPCGDCYLGLLAKLNGGQE